MAPVDDPRVLALELLASGVVLADGSGGVLAANRAARVLLGLDEGVTLRCEGRAMSVGDLVRDHAVGGAVRRRVKLEHPEFGWLRATLTRAEDARGAACVHLTAERGPAPDWRLAGRSDPLSVFAHELRNTLTSLREGLALVAEGAAGELSALQRRLLDGVREDANRMTRLAEDMVAANRLQAGRVRVTARAVDLGELGVAAVQAYASTAATAEVTLSAEPVEAGLCCHADRDLMAQALSNLVSNAVKCTPAGGIVCVGASRMRDAAGEELVELWVRDTGPGLTAAQVADITRTADGERPPEGRWSGLGIGLSIVREIAEQHSGQLTVESAVGAGSCFRLRAPTDFRQSRRWALGQVADALKLARAVGAPLAVAEVELRAPDGEPWAWEGARGLVHLPLIEQCVVDCLRPSDVVLMGEQSATLVLHDVDATGARRAAGRAIEQMEQLLAALPDAACPSAVAVGVASYPDDGDTAEALMAAARDALAAGRPARTETDFVPAPPTPPVVPASASQGDPHGG